MGDHLRQNFDRQVDSNVARLLDSYSLLLKRSQLAVEIEGHEQTHILAASTNIVHASQCLLDQIQEIRNHLLLNDSKSIHDEIEVERQNLKKRLKCLDDRGVAVQTTEKNIAE